MHFHPLGRAKLLFLYSYIIATLRCFLFGNKNRINIYIYFTGGGTAHNHQKGWVADIILFMKIYFMLTETLFFHRDKQLDVLGANIHTVTVITWYSVARAQRARCIVPLRYKSKDLIVRPRPQLAVVSVSRRVFWVSFNSIQKKKLGFFVLGSANALIICSRVGTQSLILQGWAGRNFSSSHWFHTSSSASRLHPFFISGFCDAESSSRGPVWL